MTKPVKTYRVGMITASVWGNKSDDKPPYYTVTIQRSFKKHGEWDQSVTFNHDDLLNVAKVAERAEQFISEQ